MVQTKGLKPKLLIIAGPTASGKSELAVSLAKEFGGEIISCDSMQIYKGLDIGTGKISKSEQSGIPHHMIDIIPSDAEYSVGEFVKQVKQIISEIDSRNKLPILAGGTGFYINGLLGAYNFAGVSGSGTVREKYKRLAEDEGVPFVWEKLNSVDPASALTISKNDLKRIIRALEIYETTGTAKSLRITKRDESEYDYLFLNIKTERDVLYKRIEARVDRMLEAGLIEEASRFYPIKNKQSMQAIGYKECVFYFEGLLTLYELSTLIKRNTRRYAKRQLTYLKGMDFEKISLNLGDLEQAKALVREKWYRCKYYV